MKDTSSVNQSHLDQASSGHEIGVSSVTTSHSIVEQSDENQMSSRHKSDICTVTSETQLGRDQLNLRHETSSSCTNTGPGYTQGIKTEIRTKTSGLIPNETETKGRVKRNKWF